MKKNIQCTLTVVMLVFSYLSTQAQVDFNGNINDNSLGLSSAFIDASASSTWNGTTNIGKGMVFPRTNLTEFSSFAMIGPTIGLNNPNLFDGFLVFNIGTGVAAMGGDSVFPGFYYYRNTSGTLNGGNWVQISPSSDSDDQNIANLGVDASTNVLTVGIEDGTSQTVDLSGIVKEPWFGDDDDAAATTNTENIYHMGDVGIGVSTTPGAKLDVQQNSNATNDAILKLNRNGTGSDGFFGISFYIGVEENYFNGLTESGDNLILFDTDSDPFDNSLSRGLVIGNFTDIDGERGLKITESGRLGVGTSLPTQTLDVNGQVRIRTLEAGSVTNQVVMVDGMGVLKKTDHTSLGTDDQNIANLAVNATTNVLTVGIEDGTSQTVDLSGIVKEPWFGTDDNSAATLNTEDIYQMGSVGIGRNNPSYKLDVNGSFRNVGPGLFSVMNANDDMTINKRGIYIWDDTNNAWGIYMSRPGLGRSLVGDPAIAATGGSTFNDYAIRFRVQDNANRGFIFENSNEELLMSIRGDGFVHFEDRVRVNDLPAGTASDEFVVADANGVLKKVTQSSVGDGDAWGVNGEDETSWVARTGNVGIGLNTAPSQKLHVAGNAQIGSAGEELRLGYMGYNNWAGISHKDRASAGNYALMQNALGTTLINASEGQSVSFRINNTEGARLHSNNNFGIGTTSPAAKLHVVGNARITSMATGSTSDQVVMVDGSGNLKKISAATLSPRHHDISMQVVGSSRTVGLLNSETVFVVGEEHHGLKLTSITYCAFSGSGSFSFRVRRNNVVLASFTASAPTVYMSAINSSVTLSRGDRIDVQVYSSNNGLKGFSMTLSAE